MDRKYKDIHIQLDGKDVSVHRAIASEIKIFEDRIVYYEYKRTGIITENIILIPILKGIKVLID